jgi:branched-subunit amino acid aminotransferase/4-amino-4-deoxychorismate lyase
MAAIVNVNGNVSDQEHAVVSVFDHGFLYGEGIYETLRTYNGQAFLFDRHMRRLRNSAQMLALPVPLSDAEIDARFRDTVKAAGLGGSP